MEERLCILVAAHKWTNIHVHMPRTISITDWENQTSFSHLLQLSEYSLEIEIILGGGGSTSGVENICTPYPLNISHTHALYRYRYQCNILINTCIHRMSCITVCIGTSAMPAQSLVNNLQSHRTTRFRKQICYKLFSTV